MQLWWNNIEVIPSRKSPLPMRCTDQFYTGMLQQIRKTTQTRVQSRPHPMAFTTYESPQALVVQTDVGRPWVFNPTLQGIASVRRGLAWFIYQEALRQVVCVVGEIGSWGEKKLSLEDILLMTNDAQTNYTKTRGSTGMRNLRSRQKQKTLKWKKRVERAKKIERWLGNEIIKIHA